MKRLFEAMWIGGFVTFLGVMMFGFISLIGFLAR